MKYEWDYRKNRNNIEKHGLDFNDAVLFFENPYLTFSDLRFNYGEERYFAIGTIRSRVIVLIFTKRKDTIRIISMRKANERESKKFKDRLGKN
ncbi:MAG: BrnT family toxin [Candidatus Omnitrophica bacterium]|nr:BrnT family toxin [Candidatus Omnitrophota bacterium]